MEEETFVQVPTGDAQVRCWRTLEDFRRDEPALCAAWFVQGGRPRIAYSEAYERWLKREDKGEEPSS